MGFGTMSCGSSFFSALLFRAVACFCAIRFCFLHPGVAGLGRSQSKVFPSAPLWNPAGFLGFLPLGGMGLVLPHPGQCNANLPPVSARYFNFTVS